MVKNPELREFPDVDGTKLKAYNSHFKVICKHDLKGELAEKEIKKLKHSAQKFYFNEKKTCREKLELFERMYE